MKKTKILICGGRHFNDYDVFSEKVNAVFNELGITREETELVSGGCEGTDKMAERFAEENIIPIRVFSADWKKYGKAAGPIRNKQMVDYIKDSEERYVIAFTSDKTKGTRNTIKLAVKNGIEVFELDYRSFIEIGENENNFVDHKYGLQKI